MPIVVNGTGTVTGISVGGLPDGIVDTDMLAADSVTAAKIEPKTFVSYALLKDTKGQNTDGGTFTSGAWRTRDLNTEISDEDGIVSISSNQFTLAAGNYFIRFQAPALKVNFHQARLRNNTDGINYNGTSEYSQNTDAFQTVSFGVARVAIGGSKAFEVQHRCTETKTTDGFGQPAYGFGDESIYTLVEIYKEA